MKPHVVRRIVDGEREIDVKSTVVRRAVSQETAATLTKMLASALERANSEALVPGYRIAGKTGTAQKFDLDRNEYNSEQPLISFCGFFPVEKPYTATRKKHSHRLHMVQPKVSTSDANLYGTIRITWYEALSGARKLVNVPWGFNKRLIRVTIPPGIKEGKSLRLKGMGKELPYGERGDLYLKVVIESKAG